jgi:hypothetical protein
MKVDFYHIDAFEAENYFPIWRELVNRGVNARMVGVPGMQNAASKGWFNHNKFVEYCDREHIPFHADADFSADVGITTQNATILRDYDCKVRLMYGPILYPKAWGLQPHSVQPFDAVLVHGAAYQARFSQWLPHKNLPVIGYPRYDDFFLGRVNKALVLKKIGAIADRPLVLFLPTWANNTVFDKILPALESLSEFADVFIRPHHCTVRFEPQRMECLQAAKNVRIAPDRIELPDLLASADVVIADVRSGAFTESLLCDRPTIGTVLDVTSDADWLKATGLDRVADLNSDPASLAAQVRLALTQNHHADARKAWAEQHVAYRDGRGAQAAADAIIELCEKTKSFAKRTVRNMSQDTPPVKISIVLPTYNHLNFLAESINSILRQTLDDFELIIVDDGSTDGTSEYLLRNRTPKMRLIIQENQGLPNALNAGFSLARGRYWTWTSADNIVAPTWLEMLVQALETSPVDVRYALSAYANINAEGHITSINRNQCFELESLLCRNGNASFLYEAELARQVGSYDPSLTGAEDLDMWIRMAKVTRAVHVDSILYYYRLHDNSMTHQIPDRVWKATEATIRKFLTGSGGVLDVDQIFPTIRTCPDPPQARLQALIWLSYKLAMAPQVPVEALVDLLEKAYAQLKQPFLVVNIAILLGLRGYWTEAETRLTSVNPSPEITRLLEIIACRDKAALQLAPFSVINEGDLLFERRTQLSAH